MSDEQKPQGEEPKGTKNRQKPPRVSHKPEPVKAVVVAKHIEGNSNREIARKLGIDRETVAAIVEEVDMATVLQRNGLDDDSLVRDHLIPLLKAEKHGLYGTEAAGATRLGALRLIDKWKGISASVKARIEAKAADARTMVRPATHTVCLVVSDERRAARLARLLAPGGTSGVVINVDAKVDGDPGREGQPESVQAVS